LNATLTKVPAFVWAQVSPVVGERTTTKHSPQPFTQNSDYFVTNSSTKG